MKIILSRKGFDSASGGYPSPHFIDDGRLLSFPIPEENNANSIGTGITYADLQVDDALSYLDVMKQLGINRNNKFDGKYVHLDPDIKSSVLSNRNDGWRGMFGQCSSAQGHLRNNGVEPGDLFLFFGLFRDVVKTDSGYKYVSGTDRHIIWGYLQIEKIQQIEQEKKYEQWQDKHPHYIYRKRTQNTGYIGSRNLSFAAQLPGYGTFNFKESLVLTCPRQKKCSIWKLPQFFHPSYGTKMSRFKSRYTKSNKLIWELQGSNSILDTNGQWQEFVLEGNKEIENWTKLLFKNI